MEKFKLLLFVLTGLINSVWGGELTARLNVQSIAENGSFQLILGADGKSDTPDLTPLQKDFNVLGSSQSTRMHVINGNFSQTNQWIVTLSPKRQGRLTIPIIHAGKNSSEPLSIDVVDASQVSQSQGEGINLVIRVNGNGEKIYIFQPIPITVRIETTQPFLQASIEAPKIDDAELIQSGNDRQSQITQNGELINIIERDYVLRVQKPGELSIKPFILKGEIIDRDHRPRDDFDSMFGEPIFFPQMMQSKSFMVKSNTLALKVEKGGKVGEWFLPAKAVDLKAEWIPKKAPFKIGEPVIRQISLLALGAQPEQLPSLKLPMIDGVKIYTDNDITDTIRTREGLVARRLLTLSIIPERRGKITLPQLSVIWQNIQTNKKNTAILPAEVIEVTGESLQQVVQQDATKQHSLSRDKAKAIQNMPTNKANNFRWGFLLFFMAIMAFVGISLRYFPKKPPSDDDGLSNTSRQKQLKKIISDAINNKNISQLYQGLLHWKQLQSNACSSLDIVLLHVESVLFEEKTEIDFSLISQEVEKTFLFYDKEKKLKRNQQSLPSLYK